MTYTLDDIYSQLNEIKLMMAENGSSGGEDKNAEGLYASAIGKGAKAGGSPFLNLVNNINHALSATKSNLVGIYSELNKMIDPWAKVDDAASKYAKTIAMTEEGMKRLRKTTIDNVVNAKIGINYNVSPDELIKYQQKYAQSIGRALRIDNTQQESLAAMHAVMDGRENELAAAFENFGVSLNGVADHAGKMFADASKSGLSFEKYSDNVAKNIKIAQNYTFKNGLKGLESMAKKATALKLDMGQVASFADKVSTIEGAIDVASKLQVLGGSFAGIADPLGMLNEGLMDMEGLTDRVIKMVGGMGAFNKQTGEVEVSAFNKQRIKAAAQAMGMDYSQLMESVNAGAKREEITRQISASANATGLNNDMKELIKNSATFNEEGKAGVSINGQFKTLDELSDEDYNDLVKETQDQAADIKDIAKTLRSVYDVEKGAEKQYKANKAQITERRGDGDRMKKIVDLVGSSNRLLKIIAYSSFTKSIFQIGTNVINQVGGLKNIFSGKRWRGDKSIFANKIGKGGRFGSGIGSGLKEYGTYANKIGRSKWFKGTKFGNAMRKWGAKSYKIAGKANAKEAQLLSKFTGKFGQHVGKFGNIGGKFGSFVGKFGKIGGKFGNVIGKFGGVGGRLGGRLGAGALQTLAYEKLGTTALSAVQKLGGVGANLAARSGIAGKAGAAMFKAAAGAESKLLTQGGVTAVKGMSGKAVGEAVGKGLLKGAGKGLGVGLAFGVASAGLEMGRDALIQKGKMKKGGFGDSMMTITAEQAKWAGMGMMGGWWGAAAGAVIGTVTGLVKAVKRNREARVDNKLEHMGIQRKGDYGARSYKLINKALDTGEISNRMRKKLEKKGDWDMLDAIDKKKKEKDEKKRKDRNERLAAIFGGRGGNIAKGTFTVTNAYFNGDAFGGTNIERKGEYSDEENKAIDEALKSGKISEELKQKLSESGDEEILKAIENRKENPTEGNGIMAQRNKFGVANFEIGVANFSKLGSIRDARREKRKENIQRTKAGMKAGFGASELMAGLLTFNHLAIYGGIKKIKSSKKKREELKAAKESGISNIKGFPEEGFSSELAGLKKSAELFGQKKGDEINQQQSENKNSLNGGKIDLNISGTIKLEGANGKQVDITKDLLKDSNFIREITKLITQRIGENQVGSNRQDNNNMARTI